MARRQAGATSRPRSRHLPRTRIGIAVAVAVGVALAGGTTYAGITLLQSVTQGDPAAAAVYRQNLGETLALSQTRDGVTLKLVRAYADVNGVMLTYAVHPDSGTLIYAGFATGTGQPIVSDSRGQTLPGYDAYFQTHPQTNDSVGIIKYDAETVPATVPELALTVTVPGLHLENSHGSIVAGPYAFHFLVPVSSGQTMNVGRTVTVDGVGITLDRVVATPSETRIYMRASVGFSARITGKGYDTRTGVISDPTELVEFGNTFQAPNGEEVETFNNTLYGKRGSFTLTIDSIGSSNRIVGPWVFHFVVP
ncbi:MAG: hypothetical protein WB805_05585 [Candidatus Dormiibacterota bacterium]